MQRRLVYDALQRLPADLPDPLPDDVRVCASAAGALRGAARRRIFRRTDAPLDALNRFATPAQRRLIFEEAFLFQIGVLARRRRRAAERKPASDPASTIASANRRAAVLPFKLTAGQRQALKEIVDDLQRPQPMNRLLQGDVGAGKTIVALLAALVAMENGLQVAFMAPTEILAEQHFVNIARLLQPSRFRVALLTGSTGAAARRDAARARSKRARSTWSSARTRWCRATCAFKQLGLVVIDEQHRFGVLQRATLRAKGLHPDVLVMTATPIPRTLALTLYGDLDVSVIRDLPPGRLPIKTIAKPESRRDEDLRSSCASSSTPGRQAYVIYPLVEESEKIDLKAATEMADHLAQEVFPELPRRPAARPAEGRREGSGDEGVRGRRAAAPGLDDGRRSRRRRAERHRDDRRARRALRPVAAAPAARPRRPRRVTSRTASCCISRRCPTRRASG